MISGMHVVVAGFVAKDPTFQTFPDGSSKAKLRVGFSARWQSRDTGEWTDGPTSFVGVQCWRGLAESVAICVRKGDPVIVRGRLTIRSYQNPAGEWRQAVDVDADAIGHDLNRGVAQFSRIRRAAGDAAAARNRALAAMSAVASRRAQAEAGAVAQDQEDGVDVPGGTGHDEGLDEVESAVTGRDDAIGQAGRGDAIGQAGRGDGSGRDDLIGQAEHADVVDETAVAGLAAELAGTELAGDELAGPLAGEPAVAVPA